MIAPALTAIALGAIGLSLQTIEGHLQAHNARLHPTITEFSIPLFQILILLTAPWMAIQVWRGTRKLWKTCVATLCQVALAGGLTMAVTVAEPGWLFGMRYVTSADAPDRAHRAYLYRGFLGSCELYVASRGDWTIRKWVDVPGDCTPEAQLVWPKDSSGPPKVLDAQGAPLKPRKPLLSVGGC